MNGSESRGHFTVTINIEIRPARADDLEALEWMGMFAAHRDIFRATFRAQERGDALMLLAIARGFPIAQIWIDFTRRLPQRIATIWAVRTFPPLQGRSIGAHMMEAAEDAIRARGFERAELEVERDNTAAKRFYRRHGWRTTGKTSTANEAAREGQHAASSAALELVTLEKTV